MNESIFQVAVPALAVIVFICFIAMIVAQVLGIRRAGGMSAFIVGGRLGRTLGEVDAHSGGMTEASLRVHTFREVDATRRIGLELGAHNRASYSALVAGLSSGQARELAGLLRRAAGEETPAGDATRRPARDGPV